MSSDDVIHQLASYYGVVGRYRDLSGREQPTSLDTKRALLEANGVELGSERDNQNLLKRIQLAQTQRRIDQEIIFDVGVGDLFVIRVAGNVIAPSLVGSIEFAAGNLGARLVVVLGHTNCGAMDATLETVQRGTMPESDNLRLIVDRIRPSAERALAVGGSSVRAELVDLAGRENVRSTVEAIRNTPGIIRRLAGEDGLMVIGAEYSLATGAVEFF